MNFLRIYKTNKNLPNILIKQNNLIIKKFENKLVKQNNLIIKKFERIMNLENKISNNLIIKNFEKIMNLENKISFDINNINNKISSDKQKFYSDMYYFSNIFLIVSLSSTSIILYIK
jgi:hypothetical protein